MRRGSRLQVVAGGPTAHGVPRAAQVTQPVYVAAQGAVADLEPPGRLGTRPVAVGLELERSYCSRSGVVSGSRIRLGAAALVVMVTGCGAALPA